MRNDITSLRKREIQEDLLWILAYARMEYKCIDARLRENDNGGK